MESLKQLDYFAIAIYMLLMAGIGLFLGKFVKNIGDYFKGGNSIPWISGAISNFMTKFSTFIFVAYAGIAYTDGMVAITLIWSTVVPALFGAFIFAKKWRRAGIITPMEYLETRFSPAVRQVFSWSGVGFKILDNMVRLYALALFVNAATGISLEASILTCGIIVALYTIAGGLWAVVITDVVQFVILIVATLILLPLTIKAGGGISNIMATIPDQFHWFKGPKGMPLYVMVYYLMILIKYSGNWTFIQRFYSVRDETAGKKQALLSAAFFLIFPFIFLFPSIVARQIIPDLANPEMAYVSICLKLLPEGIMGLMVAAMFAATMSVLSGEYNVTAGVLTKDIYQRVFKSNASDQELLWVGRMMTLFLGALITVGALYVGGFGGAFEANKLFTGLFALPMTIPLILGVILKRPNPTGALATVGVGIIVGLVLNSTKTVSWEMGTLIEIVVCVAIFLISGIRRSSNQEYNNRVAAFFKRIKTPLREDEKPIENWDFQRSMNRLYAIALLVVGLLFMAMSIPSMGNASGNSSFIAGILCLILAVVMWFVIGKKKTELKSPF
ncbi:sodium:solute symporter family transporter [Pedobacter jamesrossensis]|uniref:Sodium/solute symporter n=1 Tax=Pedobacter jamesrossensis TaxID=1908238 RepID=A0ABV8NPP1_9SPHI